MHQWTLAQKARKNGAKIVVIDVHKNQTGRLADWFIPILQEQMARSLLV